MVHDRVLNRPDELNARRQRGGWHHTGDLGRREADGSLTFVGPMTRLIKSAAENIYPAEVEACLRTPPGGDRRRRHRRARPRRGVRRCWPWWCRPTRPRAPAEGDLIAHCRDRIASYKKPRRVVFVDSLPRRRGAVDYDALDAAHGGGGYPGRG